jgi:aspartate carbamoyltransferase catalytic subunit
VKEYIDGFPNTRQEEYSDMREAVQGANVLYVTRVQKERFEDVEEYEKVKVSHTQRMKNSLSWILKSDGL